MARLSASEELDFELVILNMLEACTTEQDIEDCRDVMVNIVDLACDECSFELQR